jgi:hypothetical protein
MHPYIPYLLDDIKRAYRNETSYMYNDSPETIEEQLEQIDRWITGELETHTFGYYCGLEVANLPPAVQLDDWDIELVCDAFNKLLDSWNAAISIPDTVPLRLRYTLMISILDEEFTPVKFGTVTFDFCSGYAPDCPLKEYCPCLDIWNENDDSLDSNNISDD